MLAAVETKEDIYPVSPDYYYLQPSSHQYYCPIPFHDDSNNPHHYRSSIYETNHYYAYDHQQLSRHLNETSLSNPVSSTIYRTGHYQRCPSEEQADDIVYTSKLSDYPLIAAYDHNLISSNPPFSEHSPYGQSSVEPVNCNTNTSPTYSASYLPSNGACQSGSVTVELANRPLWMKFVSHTHENVITKTGRRMFPTLEFKVSGLKPEATYDIYVEMVLADTHQWKFNCGKWVASEQGESCQKNSQYYLHPDSPSSGTQWMRHAKISFSKLKLTNNKQLSSNQSQNQKPLLLNSMRKYVPHLTIVQVSDPPTYPVSTPDENSLLSPKHTFTFAETQFIAVTAYQNTDITQLKIDNNPFAKGFRDNLENRNMYDSHTYSALSPPEGRPDDHRYTDLYEHEPCQKKRRRC